MVDLTRRKTVLGLGMLAVGSGSAFTSAAFNNSVNPSSDMRVLVDESLTLEPGILFRNGSTDTSPFNPSASNPPASETLKDRNSNSLFGGNNSPGLDSITADEIPAAAINNEDDGDLFLEVAVALGETAKIGNAANGVFQVRNNTTNPQDVAIRFPDFGEDGDGDTDDLTEKETVETFRFFDSTNTQISTDNTSTTPQTVDNVVTVASGAVEQIHVDYDTVTHSGKLETAADLSGGGNPFDQQGTVDLVDTIDVGTENGNHTS